MGRDEADKVRLSVGEAKARLLEYGHRPRGPKAAIRRDPVTAAAVAFFAGIVMSRFRPGPLMPLGALLSKPLLKRVLPIVSRLVATQVASRMQAKANGKAPRGRRARATQHTPYQQRTAPPPPGAATGGTPGTSREWALGPQREGLSPPRARS